MSDKVTREERLLEVLKILPYLRSKHPLYHEEFDAIRALIREHGPEVSREFVGQLALRLETFKMPKGEYRAPFEVIAEMFLIPAYLEAGVGVKEG